MLFVPISPTTAGGVLFGGPIGESLKPPPKPRQSGHIYCHRLTCDDFSDGQRPERLWKAGGTSMGTIHVSCYKTPHAASSRRVAYQSASPTFPHAAHSAPTLPFSSTRSRSSRPPHAEFVGMPRPAAAPTSTAASGYWLQRGTWVGGIEQESNVDSHQKNRMGNRVIQVYPPFKNPLMRWPVSSDFPHKLSQGMN